MKNVGLLGELQVEQKLVERGWHPVRLDTASMASNADLLAINREKRVAIQVKTTRGKGHSHADFLGFGYSTGYCREGKPIFNAKISPLIADIVVGVSYLESGSRFVVMPVGFAEKLCRHHCDYWSAVPTKGSGKRSISFPIYISLSSNRQAHREHHGRNSRNLLKFEDGWDILNAEPEQLRNPEAWELCR